MVKELQLIRLAEHPKYGTFGQIIHDNIPVCPTVELPWKNNERSVSCIPPNRYLVTPYTRQSGRNAFLVNDVPARTSILIHIANLAAELRGCIAPGVYFKKIWTKKHQGHGVAGSTEGMNNLKAIVKGMDRWYLTIYDRRTI